MTVPGARLAGLAELAAVVRRFSSRRALAGLLTLQLVVAVTEGVGLTLLVPVVQAATGGSTDGLGGVLPIGGTAALVLVVPVILVRAGAQWAAAIWSATLRLRTVDGLRLEVLDAVLGADWRYLIGQQRSHLVQTLTTEMQRAGAAVDVLGRVGVNVLLAAAATVAAVALSPLAGGGAVLAVLAVGLLARGTMARSAEAGSRLGGSIHRFGDAVSNTLASLPLIRAHDAGDAWLRVVRAEASTGRAVQLDYARRSAGVRLALAVAGAVALVLLLLLARELDVATAVLVALAAATARLLGSAQQLVATLQLAAHLAPSISRATALAAAARQHAEAPAGGRDRPGSADSGRPPNLCLRGVQVRYDADLVLDGLDLRVVAGTSVAVTGGSGAGKSTLLAVVLGLLVPDAGEVRVDGAPVTDLTGWRARIGFVPQEVVLVTGNVRTNVAWSAVPGQDLDDEAIWAALTEAGLAAVVERLPDGLDTDLGDFTRLSGGERQRLGIARALVRRPSLLVLDEATSALDPATEAAVLDGLLDGRRTVVLVTHRPGVARRTDQAVRLRAGRAEILERVARPEQPRPERTDDAAGSKTSPVTGAGTYG